jgi:hypothetical protein
VYHVCMHIKHSRTYGEPYPVATGAMGKTKALLGKTNWEEGEEGLSEGGIVRA